MDANKVSDVTASRKKQDAPCECRWSFCLNLLGETSPTTETHKGCFVLGEKMEFTITTPTTELVTRDIEIERVKFIAPSQELNRLPCNGGKHPIGPDRPIAIAWAEGRSWRLCRKCSEHLWKATRVIILERDNHTCQYCGMPASHVDHVVPVVQGGGDAEENLVAACRSCNLRKGGRTPGEAGMELTNTVDFISCCCSSCDWQGAIYNCELDIDGDGNFGCPVCKEIVKID